MVTGLSDDNSSDDSVENLHSSFDANDVEQICEAIFTLIPEVSRLKELFLCWSLLDAKARAEVDAQVCKWGSPERVQLYKPLKEALRRWELLQDTQGEEVKGC
ncbi:Uncharacterized protein GBIM_05322 [Gryllus bimaculatus]|nr:Uncharacterized protein GBIM_05322 [Gryllus bimaculatus]